MKQVLKSLMVSMVFSRRAGLGSYKEDLDTIVIGMDETALFPTINDWRVHVLMKEMSDNQ